MSLTVFRHEFKMRWRSVVTWSAAIGVVMLVYISLFSSFASQADQINQLMANYPKELLDAFGLNGTDLSTVMGFFGVVFLFAQILLAIQAGKTHEHTDRQAGLRTGRLDHHQPGRLDMQFRLYQPVQGD
jgi:putative exporter of polyketide antibiotics